MTDQGTRDPEITRRRIVEAALAQFSDKGYAGARVDEIARQAGTSVRMLYHYFGNKQSLWRAVLHERVTQRPRVLLDGYPPVAEFVLHHFETLERDPSFVRMMVWEGMSGGAPDDLGAAERRAGYQRIVEYLRDQQERGSLDSELEPDMALLLIIAAGTFVRVFPQVVKLVTGLEPNDDAFTARFRAALRRYAELLSGHPTSPAARGDVA
jgi:AcrR family transcriptional regulator